MLQFGLFRFLGLKRRYSFLFGLINNLFATIQENISQIHDSINEKTVVTSGEKINIFGCHQHENGYEFQDIEI